MEGGTAVPIGQVHVSIKRLLAQQEKTTRPRLLHGWDFFEPCIRTNQINDSKELGKSLSFLHDIFGGYLFLYCFKASYFSSADQNILFLLTSWKSFKTF